MSTIERLKGPSTYIDWTPGTIPSEEYNGKLVSLVREADLAALEAGGHENQEECSNKLATALIQRDAARVESARRLRWLKRINDTWGDGRCDMDDLLEEARKAEA